MALVVKNPAAIAEDVRDSSLIPGLGRSWRRSWQPTPRFLPGETHGRQVCRAAKSWTLLEQLRALACMHYKN